MVLSEEMNGEHRYLTQHYTTQQLTQRRDAGDAAHGHARATQERRECCTKGHPLWCTGMLLLMLIPLLLSIALLHCYTYLPLHKSHHITPSTPAQHHNTTTTPPQHHHYTTTPPHHHTTTPQHTSLHHAAAVTRTTHYAARTTHHLHRTPQHAARTMHAQHHNVLLTTTLQNLKCLTR